jgi:hypothetical protein
MSFDVTFDKSRQIIRCRGEGILTGMEAEKVSTAVTAVVKDLDDPSRVRILVDGRSFDKMDADARRVIMADYKRDDLYRMAIWGVPGYIRLFLNAWYRAFGTDKVHFFDTEAAALNWLTGEKES